MGDFRARGRRGLFGGPLVGEEGLLSRAEFVHCHRNPRNLVSCHRNPSRNPTVTVIHCAQQYD